MLPATPIVALRPFVPATDYPRCLAFYTALGFTATPFGDALAQLQLGAFNFLLQAYNAESYAQHLMMQLVVDDLDAWWQHIASLDLPARFGVPAPKAPALQPWGLTVVYVIDPTGILWHVCQSSQDG